MPKGLSRHEIWNLSYLEFFPLNGTLIVASQIGRARGDGGWQEDRIQPVCFFVTAKPKPNIIARIQMFGLTNSKPDRLKPVLLKPTKNVSLVSSAIPVF
jgi:hypothetical protein